MSQTMSAPAETPTGLKTVLDAIPDRCYERSTARGLGIFARDVVLYGLVLAGLALTNNVLLLIPLWIAAALLVSGLFVVGHDAAHDALFDSKKLNFVIARLAMLPSLHATEQWVFGHNRVHHGHTLRETMDFVWHPTSPDQWETMGRFARLRHRFEWSMFGSGAYYAREVWWNKMVMFKPPERWAKPMHRDRAFVAAFALAALVLSLVFGGVGGIWIWVKLIVIPFLLFSQVIGWVVYIHHIAPEIRWWPRREWNRFRGQVEGTTVLWGPPGWDFFFHWIMVHLPHHVDMKIPCYHLPEAARAIAAEFPDYVDERPIRLSDYFRSAKECKLHDFQTGIWSTYP